MSIDQTTLAAQLREKTGKGVARRLRARQLIPAVVYGPHSEKPLTIAVDPKALREAIKTPHRLNTILTLKLDGGLERVALLKTYQQDPVTRQVLHADFYEVRLDEPVKVPVPLALVGKPEGVTTGGILQQNRREIEVSCLPRDIPEKIDVDVSHLKMAQALHVSDVKAPPGVKLHFATDYTVAIVAIPEKEEVVAPPPAAAAAAAVPGAPAEPGKAPAPGAAPGAAPAAAAAAPPAAGKAAPAKK